LFINSYVNIFRFVPEVNKKLLHRERLEHKAEDERDHDYIEYVDHDYRKEVP